MHFKAPNGDVSLLWKAVGIVFLLGVAWTRFEFALNEFKLDHARLVKEARYNASFLAQICKNTAKDVIDVKSCDDVVRKLLENVP